MVLESSPSIDGSKRTMWLFSSILYDLVCGRREQKFVRVRLVVVDTMIDTVAKLGDRRRMEHYSWVILFHNMLETIGVAFTKPMTFSSFVNI